MAKIDSLEASLLVNGKAKDVFELIESSGIGRDWQFKLKLSNPDDLYLGYGLKYQKANVGYFGKIDVLFAQEEENLTRVFIFLEETKIVGALKRDIIKQNSQRSIGFSTFVAMIEGACNVTPAKPVDLSEIDDVSTLMAMTEAAGSTDAATIRLIEIAKHHEESGNQVEALLILAPLASKYCIPAIDALTRISAEKGDMAGLQSWSTQKAHALQIVSSGKGSPVSGVPRNILPQLATLGFVATNMNLIGIKNELGDISAMANEEYDSGDSDSGSSESFGDFF
jgi:hypothetical protein